MRLDKLLNFKTTVETLQTDCACTLLMYQIERKHDYWKFRTIDMVLKVWTHETTGT